MENGEKGAFAVDGKSMLQTGLTKREYFAGLAMQSYVNNLYSSGIRTLEDAAKRSVQMADALLAELEKNKSE
jgi:hypothetical protein